MKTKAVNKLSKGQLAIQILMYGTIAIIFLSGFLIWLNSTVKSVVRAYERSEAFGIAESGIEYYRWHLAHAPADYQDGTNHAGPYTHNFYNKNGDLIGKFILDITPPVLGSTIITVKSTGNVTADNTLSKIITVKMGVPSFAKYAGVFNDNIRFGQGTEVFGALHSNGGIRFDGIAHNLVTSALTSYDDPDHTGGNEFGVHTHVNAPPSTGVNDTFRPLEAPPNPPQNRNDVFLVGRNFPVPAVDFLGITQTLAQIKTSAQTSGFYKASSTNHLGYDLVLKTNHTFDLYKITGLVPSPGNCSLSQNEANNQDGWGTWSIQSETLIGNYPIPANGIIFIEDNLWVRGQINGNRVTIASAIFPDNIATRTNITVNTNLLYTNYDGTDVISLITQNNINIGFVSDDVIRIDGALVAQNGRVGRYYYDSSYCPTYAVRSSLTAYGMIASYHRYGFAYTDGTGYTTRNLIYDSNLLYGPPPSFPLTNDPYQIISWDETQ